MQKKRFTITAALLYANGPLHIGHMAGAYLPADIFARYQKMRGHDVAFICGSDEHGAAITLEAKKHNITPKEIIDKYHHLNKKTFEDFGINFNIYHRTSSDLHHKTAQEFFTNLHENKKFIKKTTEQFFDKENNMFLADRYITGTCPKCNYDEAYGDQCEQCGSTLNPEELINPKSKISGKLPVKKSTTHWYLPMQDHESWLKEWIENGTLNESCHHDPTKWRSHVLGQCKSWIQGGLHERAMTRDLDWGVKVPLKNKDNKVLYVWLDAPIGYISATKQWALDNNKNWEEYWKNEDTELIHFIGKDNIVFHCIMFPIILNTQKQYILPKNVPANSFLNIEGKKTSTSRKFAIWIHEYLEDFVDQVDSLRYVLCATAPENKDTDFSWKDFQAKNNNELVAIFGNFINRVVVLTNKYWDGKVPKINEINDLDRSILNKLSNYPQKIGQAIEKYQFRLAIKELINLSRMGNKYLAETEPWKLQKTNMKRTETIMHIALQIAGSLSVLSEPFLPSTSRKLKTMLDIKKSSWDNSLNNLIKEGSIIGESSLLFSKIEDEKIEIQINKLNN